MARALDNRQRAAAILIGTGVNVTETARQVKVSRRSVHTWKKLPAFQRLAQQHRDSLLAEVPSAEATLHAALSAVKSDGTPNHQIRVQAARILYTRPIQQRRQPEAAQAITWHGDGNDPDPVDDDRPGTGLNPMVGNGQPQDS